MWLHRHKFLLITKTKGIKCFSIFSQQFSFHSYHWNQYHHSNESLYFSRHIFLVLVSVNRENFDTLPSKWIPTEKVCLKRYKCKTREMKFFLFVNSVWLALMAQRHAFLKRVSVALFVWVLGSGGAGAEVEF